MTDAISITAIVVSVSTALAGLAAALHIRRFRSGCLDVDCSQPTSPFSRRPTVSPPVPITLAPVPQKLMPMKLDGQEAGTSSADC